MVFSTGSDSETVSLAAGTNTTSFQVPRSWNRAAANTSSFNIKVTVGTNKVTSDGSMSIGTEESNVAATVPSDSLPVINSFTATGVDQKWGIYVSSKSKAKFTLNASGADGSSIATYSIRSIHQNSPILSYASTTAWTSNLLDHAGTERFTVTVTDSRGRQATSYVDVEIAQYRTPAVSSAKITRCNSDGTINREGGTHARLDAVFFYSKIGLNEDSLSSKVYYKETGPTSTWTPAEGVTVAISDATPNVDGTKIGYAVFGDGLLDVAEMYEIRIEFTDSYHTSPYTVFLSTVSRVFDFRQTRAALGGLATYNKALQVPFDW